MDRSTAFGLSLLAQTRQNVVALLDAQTEEQLNRIPPGLNNNLIWNAGHLIATSELLVYALSGHRTPSGREFIDRYRKGTRPEGAVGSDEIAAVKQQLTSGVERLREDLMALDWDNFKEYGTSFGVTLHGVDEALQFNNMHETMHFGTMLTMRKMV